MRKDSEITPTDLEILRYVYRNLAVVSQQVGHGASRWLTDVDDSLDKLTVLGLVEKNESEFGLRVHIFTATDEGVGFLQKG